MLPSESVTAPEPNRYGGGKTVSKNPLTKVSRSEPLDADGIDAPPP